MLYKTQGVVLHNTQYNDRYLIVNVYTEQFGRVSYMVAKNRGKKSTLSKALFIPMAVVDMEVEHLSNREIHRVKECRLSFPENELLFNPIKRVLALFLSEVLYRTLKNSEPEKKLFDFLVDSVRILENAESGYANFHIVFLLHLLHYLGFFPNTENANQGWFDMLNAEFTMTKSVNSHCLDLVESRTFANLLRISYENMALYEFSRVDRVRILKRILEYYRLHLPEFSEIKSLEVLQTLFD